MNYDAFMEPITWFLTGMEKHSDEMREELRGNADHFMGAMSHHMANMLVPSLLTSMNQLSNHDHSPVPYKNQSCGWACGTSRTGSGE